MISGEKPTGLLTPEELLTANIRRGVNMIDRAMRYRFFQNRECEYFPCHAGVKEEDFNCLFCFCPLYALGRRCGGSCVYTDEGIKSCEQCVFPHERENYDAVTARYREIADVVKRSDMEEA